MPKIINLLNRLSIFASHHNHPRASFLPSTRLHSMRFVGQFFRLSTFGLLITFHFSFLTFNSCGLDIEDPIPPSPPKWVQKTLPDEWPERGIDAHKSNGINLEWEIDSVQNVIANLIYRSTYYEMNDSIGNYELLTRLELVSKSEQRYVDGNVGLQTRYYYKIRSEDSSGNMSTFSDSTSYMLLQSIQYEMMTPRFQSQYLSENRALTWHNFYLNEVENYCITLLTFDGVLISREILQPYSYTNGEEFWQIPDSIELIPNNVYKWRIDVGADYSAGYEMSGAESQWAKFLY
jgi:hypothetical protein